MSLKDDLRQYQFPIALFLISALAFALRVYKLDAESLWLDEVLSINLASMDIPSAIRMLPGKYVHPPFYFIILHIWSRIVGQSELSLRFLSALFGPLTAAMTYKLARGLFDRRTALLSGLLLALCPYHVYYSQETRMYTLATFLGLVGAYCFFQAPERRDRVLRYWIGFVLCSALGLYTHYYSLFLLLFENLFFLSLIIMRRQYRYSFKAWLLAQLAIFCLYLPWLPVLLVQSTGDKSGWIEAPRFVDLPAALIAYFVTPNPARKLHLLTGSFGVIFPLTLGAIGAQVIEDRQGLSFPLGRSRLYVLAYLAVPFLAAYTASLLIKPILVTRYLIICVPAACILLAYGLNLVKPKFLALLLSLLLGWTMVIYLGSIYKTTIREDWRNVARYLSTRIQRDDLVCFNAGYVRLPFYYYYGKEGELNEITLSEMGEDSSSIVGKTTHFPQRIWLIISLDAESLYSQHTLETFRQRAPHSKLLSDEEFTKIEVLLFVLN
jgi:mannosyltransferase